MHINLWIKLVNLDDAGWSSSISFRWLSGVCRQSYGSSLRGGYVWRMQSKVQNLFYAYFALWHLAFFCSLNLELWFELAEHFHSCPTLCEIMVICLHCYSCFSCPCYSVCSIFMQNMHPCCSSRHYSFYFSVNEHWSGLFRIQFFLFLPVVRSMRAWHGFP